MIFLEPPVKNSKTNFSGPSAYHESIARRESQMCTKTADNAERMKTHQCDAKNYFNKSLTPMGVTNISLQS